MLFSILLYLLYRISSQKTQEIYTLKEDNKLYKYYWGMLKVNFLKRLMSVHLL